MNENHAALFLQLVSTLNLLSGQGQAQQIYFPDRNREILQPQATANAPTHVPNFSVDQMVSDLTTTNRRVTSYYEHNPESIAVRGLTKFTLDVNRVVPATSTHLANANSIVYGPLSVAGCLALIMLASVGQTYNEIAKVLGFSSGLDIQNNPLGVHEHLGSVTAKLHASDGLDHEKFVSYALGIFLQKDYPVRPAFLQASREIYRSDIVHVDFGGNPALAQDIINTWVSNRTNDKIQSLLDDFPPPNTRAIIVGVLYFKAEWEFPFFEGHTKWRPYFINGRKNPSDRMAEMMSNGGEFPYYKDTKLGLEIMGFPYKGRGTTMYVIIPNDSSVDKLRKLENSLTAEDIDRLVNSTEYTEAVVLFPKMKLENTINLRPTLQTLGVNSLFNPYQANLALLSPGIDQRFNVQEAPYVSRPLPSYPVVGQKPQQQPSFSSYPNAAQRPQQEQPPLSSYPNAAQRPQQQQPPLSSYPNAAQRPQQQQPPLSSYPNVAQRPPQQQTPPPPRSTSPRPLPPSYNEDEDRLIFTRFGSSPKCAEVFDPVRNTTRCQKYSRAKRATQNIPSLEALDNIRLQISPDPDLANPGIYADQVIHKVYMDITESGTEAAAATGITLNRSGGRVTFRADIPFIFFIYNEATKMMLFWGSVKSPTPTIRTPTT